MTVEGNIAVVRAMMERINRGDIAGASTLLDEEVAIHEPSGLPYGGLHLGRAGFVSLLTEGVFATWKDWRERTNRFVGVEDLVFRETEFHAVLRRNGECIEMPFIERFRLRDGLIVEIRPFYWDAAMIAR